MIYFSDAEIDQLILEDVPYYDLTTSLLKFGSNMAKIQFTTRHDTVVCGTEEVIKIFSKFGIKPTLVSLSGEHIEAGVKFFEAEGLAKHLHMAWRSSANLLEFASGIATNTRNLIDIAHKVNPDIEIATTRKTIPYTRKLATKAVRSGGGSVHRLGLSDSFLVFENHYKFLGDLVGLRSKLATIRNKINEKTITVEIKTVEDALFMADAPLDVLQLDKFEASVLKDLIPQLKRKNPSLKIAAAGGINPDNIVDYAKTGADIIVTSWPYLGSPADFEVVINSFYQQ